MRTNQEKFIKLVAYIFTCSFVVSGILTLPLYGVTWDEALGNMFFGQRYLYYFLTRNPQYLDFNYPNLPIHEQLPNLYLSVYRHIPYEFPPLADILSAATMEIFGYRLGWLDPIDAFHLATILLSGILLIIIFKFVSKRLDYFAAFLAILLLGTYPRFWGDMHFNVKDIPETVFFALTIIAFFIWYERPAWYRAILVGTLFAGAMAIKGSALFIPVILVIGVWPWKKQVPPWHDVIIHLKQYGWHYLFMGVVSVPIYFLLWPYLYADPSRVFDYFSYLASQGGRSGMLWNWDPLIQAISTMPETTLILLVIGLVFMVRNWHRMNSPILRLLAVWLIFPVLRNSLPGMMNFDGIRHFEEFVPAACIVAGYGGSSLVSWVQTKFNVRKVWSAMVILTLVTLNIGAIGVNYFPYLNVYHNSMIGGLDGAHNKYHLTEATDYWGSSYRAGMGWLNDNAEVDSWLYVPVAGHIIKVTGELRLRNDISLLDEQEIKELKSLDRPIYVMFVTRWGWYNAIAKYTVNNLEPVHEIIVDDVPILQIYKLTELPPQTNGN